MTRYDDDPEALAWAREKVQREIDWCDRMTGRVVAIGSGDEVTAQALRFHRSRLEDMLGGQGCVAGMFDERLPEIRAAERAAGHDPDGPTS